MKIIYIISLKTNSSFVITRNLYNALRFFTTLRMTNERYNDYLFFKATTSSGLAKAPPSVMAEEWK